MGFIHVYIKVWGVRFADFISFFLNIPLNNLVSPRPNYVIFIGYLKNGGIPLDPPLGLLVQDSDTASRVTVLCPTPLCCVRHIIRYLVLVQPRKTGNCHEMAEKLLTGSSTKHRIKSIGESGTSSCSRIQCSVSSESLTNFPLIPHARLVVLKFLSGLGSRSGLTICQV